MKAWILAATLPFSTLMAQAPEGWNRREPLSQGHEPWWGGGIWAGNGQGPPATLPDSLGLGNSLRGGGVRLEGGFTAGAWNLAGEGLAYRDPDGGSRFTLYRGHAWRRSPGGWLAGLEMEPLVWGYGLRGGYLLGESARPFPRARVQSPMTHLSIKGVNLGTWGFEAFLGRLENGRVLSSSMQDPARRKAAIAQGNDPQAPWISGFRVQAQFGPVTEFYMNYLNLFAGTVRGRGMTEGYGLGDYVTAVFGLKDTLAEADVDFANPDQAGTGADYRNKARSASEADIGIRVRATALERLLNAEDVRLYLSRGTKGMTWNWGTFLHRPLYWLGQDISRDWRNLGQGRVNLFWTETQRKAVPNLAVPNDTLGIAIRWPGFRAGLEYQDTSNSAKQQFHRTFASGLYITGFYHQGDPLGESLGGETRCTTLRLEGDLAPGLSATAWAMVGDRPFWDDPILWQNENPGKTCSKDRFKSLAASFAWQGSGGAFLQLGVSWARHSAEGFIQGQQADGFRWFSSLGWRSSPSRLTRKRG